MRELTARGNFWLPEAPDRKVGGVLEFRPGDGAKLSLIGALSEPSTFGDRSRTPGRIVGQSGNNFLTLDNCFQTYHSIGSGLDAEEFRVGKIFEGALYAKDEETNFDRLSVGLRYLFEWVGRSGLTEERSGPGAPVSWTLSVTRLEDVKATLADGVEITLCHGVGVSGDRAARSLTQTARIEFDFRTPRPLEEVSAYASSVQALVSIATNDVAEFDLFKLSHPDFEQKFPSGRPYREYVNFHVEWLARSLSTKELNPRMPFGFDAIGGLPGIVEWINNTADLRPMLNRVMGTRYAKRMYADDRFFNRCAALEGLHRLVKGTTNTKFGRRLDVFASIEKCASVEWLRERLTELIKA